MKYVKTAKQVSEGLAEALLRNTASACHLETLQ